MLQNFAIHMRLSEAARTLRSVFVNRALLSDLGKG